MLELMAVLLTIGAMLYRIFDMELLMIGWIGLGVFVICVLIFRSRQGIVAGLIAGGVLVLGALTLWRVDIPVPSEVFGNRAFDATVVSTDRRLDRTMIVVRDTDLDVKLQASMHRDEGLLPGDRVTVRGSVVAPQDFVTDSGRIFGYQAYLSSKGVVGIVNSPAVVIVEEGKFSLSRLATIVRYRVADILSKYVSFPFDGVIAGMVVGYQGGLPDEIQDLFRDTGVLHVLVLSGYNITLLAGFLFIILQRLSFKARSIVTVIAIIMLVLVSGAGVAAVRAGIMGSIAVVAGLSIRTYQPIRALVVAYLAFFFISPTSIFVDPGFHLSFLATLFMIAVLPKVEGIFAFIPDTKRISLRELLMLAFTVPIFMLPYMMYFSGNVPLSSPIANILLALVTPVIMIAGILVVLFSWIPAIASVLGVIVSVGGKALLWILEQCAKLPVWNTFELPWWMMSGIYVIVLAVLFRRELSEYLLQLQKALRQRTNSCS